MNTLHLSKTFFSMVSYFQSGEQEVSSGMLRTQRRCHQRRRICLWLPKTTISKQIQRTVLLKPKCQKVSETTILHLLTSRKVLQRSTFQLLQLGRLARTGRNLQGRNVFRRPSHHSERDLHSHTEQLRRCQFGFPLIIQHKKMTGLQSQL